MPSRGAHPLVEVRGTYLTVIEGDLDTVGSLFEHLVTPLVVVLDVTVGMFLAAVVGTGYLLYWIVRPARAVVVAG